MNKTDSKGASELLVVIFVILALCALFISISIGGSLILKNKIKNETGSYTKQNLSKFVTDSVKNIFESKPTKETVEYKEFKFDDNEDANIWPDQLNEPAVENKPLVPSVPATKPSSCLTISIHDEAVSIEGCYEPAKYSEIYSAYNRYRSANSYYKNTKQNLDRYCNSDSENYSEFFCESYEDWFSDAEEAKNSAYYKLVEVVN